MIKRNSPEITVRALTKSNKSPKRMMSISSSKKQKRQSKFIENSKGKAYLNQSMIVQKRAIFCQWCNMRTISQTCCNIKSFKSSKKAKKSFKGTKSSFKNSQKGLNDSDQDFFGRDFDNTLNKSQKQNSFLANSIKSSQAKRQLSDVCSESNSLYLKAINRKFNIARDLSKYSQVLKYGGTQRKLSLIFKKKGVAQEMKVKKEKEDRRKMHKMKFESDRDRLKKVDWVETDLYEIFKESRDYRLPIE